MTNTFLQRFTNIRREEVGPALVAGLFFFCVLTALMVIRPAREALGMQRGIEALRWLFMGTVLVTLLVNPVFGWLVSRFERLVFVAVTYLFFAVGLVAFYLLLVLTPESVGQRTGQVFYVWFSVFNLFTTMLFWALMADRFTLEQSKRLFGAIAVGGTLGAIFGPWLAGQLAEPLGTPALLPITAALGFLGLAIVGSLAALIAFEAAFRAVQRGIMRPSRETLFTVVPRADRYKAKAFIDTFVYRTGDVVGAQTEGLLGRLGMGLTALATVALPLAAAWMALGIWLGYAQRARANGTKVQPEGALA